MGSWRGFPMVALAAADGKGRIIHLGKRIRGGAAGTICGHLQSAVVDERVETGWPDCDRCIQRVGFKPG